MPTFQPDPTAGKDTLIRADNPTWNMGVRIQMDAGESSTTAVGDVRRALIAFDLSGIPASAVCTSAVLSLYHIGELATNDRAMRAYRVLRAWTEGTGNQTASGDGATWNTTDGSTAWGTAGCSNTTSDREATDIGNISLSATEAVGWRDITLTAAAVQDWWDGGLTNNGLLLQMDTETDDLHAFRTSDYTVDTSPRPKLAVVVTIPATGTVAAALTDSAAASLTQTIAGTAAATLAQAATAVQTWGASATAAAVSATTATAGLVQHVVGTAATALTVTGSMTTSTIHAIAGTVVAALSCACAAILPSRVVPRGSGAQASSGDGRGTMTGASPSAGSGSMSRTDTGSGRWD